MLGRERCAAGASVVAFAALGGVLAATGLLPAREALAASLSLASVFLPAAWLAPAGFRRRAADLAILPAAFALTLLGDPAQRAMALPPLLVLAALAAVLSARHRASPRAVLRLAACFALAVALAGSLGLVGFPAWRVALALLVPPLLTAGACLLLGWDAALVLALLVAPLPWVRWPLAASLVLALAAALAGFFLLLHTQGRESRVQSRQSHPHPGSWSLTLSTLDSQLSTSRVARGWLPGALGFALVASALAPWGLLAPHLAFPQASWLAAPLVLAALVLSPLLPPAAAGAAWLAVALTLGPPQPPPAERPGLSLSAASPSAQLPPGSGAPYVLDLALANAGSLPAGSLVATLRIGSLERPLHAGAALAEWALRRPGTRPAHGLPDHPVFRAREVGATGFWSVGNRLLLEVPTDVTPSLTRSASLPDKVLVTISQAGPARPTPPRDWPLPAWLLAAALAVAALQLAARSFDSPGAFLPWALLVAGALAARLPVEPLRLLAERHAVDLALAAFLAAWFPLARRLLPSRPFLAASALLLPLALATPHLTPPMVGDEPFHLMMLEALTSHHSVDLQRHFGLTFEAARLYSPGLAVLLLPGWLLAGRAGALALLALAGAGLVALLDRHAATLGLSRSRRALLTTAVLTTYPLATFCTQIWVEVVGGLVVVAGLVLAAQAPPRRTWIAVLAALATGVKTRLALLCFPPAVAVWWPTRRRAWGLATLVLGMAIALGAGVGWVFQGHPFGPYRRLHDLLPGDWRQPLIVLGGLLFDPAGGMVFAAPLVLLGMAGLPALWRSSNRAERGLIVGGALTVMALLHSIEWYGGGSPPFRYLVPLLPLFALAWVPLLRRPTALARLAWVLVPPSLLLAWALISRPPLSVNPGMGAWWLSSAIARRLQADTWTFFPSFLRPTAASWQVPLGIALVAAAIGTLVRWRRSLAVFLARTAVALWLVAAAGLVAAVLARHDLVVEGEAPQVARRGGRPEPAEGTFSSFTYRNGWRLRDGDGITVPLHLPTGAGVRLTGWLEGPAQGGAQVLTDWGVGAATPVEVTGHELGSVVLPGPQAAGRATLRLDLRAPPEGVLVVDRLEVVP